MEIVFKLRKCVRFIARGCVRSICDHPFLVGFLCFLILFYRLSPFMFSLLVYVCPVFISTAILLGTLLSFGLPNIPEIETEDEISLETAATMIVERSLEVDLENVETMETGEVSIVNDESYSDEEVVENHYVLIPVNEEHLDLDDESSEPGSSDSEKADASIPSYPSLSSWVQVKGGNEYEEAVDPSDSGSDLAESSSPGTSVAEIDSVLHELHPLLDNEIEDNENEDSQVGEEDDEEDEILDEEEEPEPLVMWTEEDHKNVMDLGSSETERNVRLENLMLRMRAKKNMRIMMEEMKLIDLESYDDDLPFNLTPIRTTRTNLYDLSHDFPDSAPSIMLPRRNPFDVPHDEEPSFAGGRLHEFVAFRSKGHLFHGQGRFNARPSLFAPNRQENKEVTEEYFEGASSDGMSETEHISVGHGSQSSEEKESLEDEVINRGAEFDKLEYSRVSSSSSLSEASERVYIEPTNQTIINEVIEGFQFTEPVYDISPTAVRNNIYSSITSDIHVEPDHVSTEGTSHGMENEISITAILTESSIVHPLREQQYGPTEFSNTRELEDINSDLLGADAAFHAPIPPESFVENLMDSDLGHVTLFNANNSPLSSDYASVTSTLSEASLDQIIVEGTDENEIKDSDEEVMSELDSIIDFSIKQWELVSTDYEEDIDLVAGSLFPARDAQTSYLNMAEFQSVEMNTMCSGTSEKDSSDSHNTIASDDKNYEHNDMYARNMNVRSIGDVSLNNDQADIVMENNSLAGSGDLHIPRVLDSTTELLAFEPMPLSSTNLLGEQVLDENVRKDLMQDCTCGPLEVEAHLDASLMDMETSAEASGVLAAAKLHNKDGASEDLQGNYDF